jgi:hypothetical protein
VAYVPESGDMDRASQQLAALAEVSDLFEQAAIAYWLFGGWAVDFYVGSVTRAHDDLDMTVWLEDTSRIDQLLRQSGWHHAPFEGEDGGTGYERGGVRLELTYLVRSDDGQVSIPFQSGPATWLRDEDLSEEIGELRGVRSRLLAFAPLMGGKSTPRDDPEDAAKDRADFAQLFRLRRV